MSGSLLQVRDLTVRYRSLPAPAVRKVSFDLNAGEIAGLLGRSGCGKSTLARTLLHLLPAEQAIVTGSIRLGGQELLELGAPALRRLRGWFVSLVPQEPELALNPVLSIEAQLGEVLAAHQGRSDRSRREKVREMLDAVGLPAGEFARAFPHQLSGGQRQRVVLAQALICEPKLLVADEPASSVDAVTQRAVMRLLSQFNKRYNTAILFITHDPDLLNGFAGQGLVMSEGQIVESGAWPEIRANPRDSETQGILRSVPRWPVPLPAQTPLHAG